MSNYTITLADESEFNEVAVLLSKTFVEEDVPKPQRDNGMVYRCRGDQRTSPNLITTIHQGKKGYTLYSSELQTVLQILAGLNPYLLDYPVIQLDDSGWGCPIGGTMVGAMSPTGEITSFYIPVVDHLSSKYKNSLVHYAIKAVELASMGFEKFVVESCPSPTLADARAELTKAGIPVRCREIVGHLQESLKSRFRESLVTLGVPPEVVSQSYECISEWARNSDKKDQIVKWRKILM